MVPFSVITSVMIYGAIAYAFNLQEPFVGVLISFFLPLGISLPISLLIKGYIDKIREQNERLLKLDNTNKRLFAMLSHDLRSPIAAQKGVVDMLVAGDLDQSNGKEMLQELSGKTDELLHFLNDVLNWAKNQGSNQKMNFEAFKLAEVTQPLMELYQRAAEEKNILIKASGLNQRVYANRDSYSFVFRNVLHNAIKFSRPGGIINIGSEQKDSEVYTLIEDQGVGMNAEQVAAVLDENNWYSTPGTGSEAGTGFGISACLHYLKLNKGRLEIESRPEEGSLFRIVLPEAVGGG